MVKSVSADASSSQNLRSASRPVSKRDRISIWLTLLCTVLGFVEEMIIGSEHSHEGPLFFLWSERLIATFYTYEFLVRWKESQWSIRHLGNTSFWIDLIAIAPFFVGFFVPAHRLHLVRTLRLLRLLKILPFIPGVNLLGLALARAWPQVKALLAVELIIVTFATAAIYECEREIEGTAFTSLFDSIWFTAVTVTTVGYGDMTPQSFPGRMIALLTFMTGLVLFAVFAGVVSSAITDILIDEHEGEL